MFFCLPPSCRQKRELIAAIVLDPSASCCSEPAFSRDLQQHSYGLQGGGQYLTAFRHICQHICTGLVMLRLCDGLGKRGRSVMVDGLISPSLSGYVTAGLG